MWLHPVDYEASGQAAALGVNNSLSVAIQSSARACELKRRSAARSDGVNRSDPGNERNVMALVISLVTPRGSRTLSDNFHPLKPMAQAYTEASIKTLSSLEHIRLRPGMYIGRLGSGSHAEDGIYVLLKETIDNSIDEFTMGFGKKIEVELIERTLRVRDYGRGIPLGKLVDCVSIINTGAKYDSETFQKSVGLNGVGQKAVNALALE